MKPKWGKRVTKEYVVYMLVDPRDQIVRYVGATDSAHRRLMAHVSGCGRNVLLNEWIDSLTSAGVHVEMQIVATCTSRCGLQQAEREQIKRFADKFGTRLLNMTGEPHWLRRATQQQAVSA